jgi:hypothetical protein
MKHSLILVAAYSAVAFGAGPAMGAGPTAGAIRADDARGTVMTYAGGQPLPAVGFGAYAEPQKVEDLLNAVSKGRASEEYASGEVDLVVESLTNPVDAASSAAVLNMDDVIVTECDPSCTKVAVHQDDVEAYARALAYMRSHADRRFVYEDDTAYRTDEFIKSRYAGYVTLLSGLRIESNYASDQTASSDIAPGAQRVRLSVGF